MRRICMLRLTLAGAMLLVAAPLSWAEPPPVVNYGGMLAKKPEKPQAPDVAAPPAVWPRLDTGAVVCRTQADLQRHAAAMLGQATGPADCRLINQATAINIVGRYGPGQTEVTITGTGETAWTDAWLPANPPPGSTTAASQ
jgi:hypothetical protein